MLRNGKFIKEDTHVLKAAPYDTGKVKIGSHYVPNAKPAALNKEEQFVQSILLGIEERRQSFLSKVLGLVLKI